MLDLMEEFSKLRRKERSERKSLIESIGNTESFKRSLLNFVSQISQSDEVPSVNVYFDQSGSWGREDIEAVNKPMSTLYKYNKEGKLNLNIYYFANSVGTTPNQGGGTNCQAVIDHINKTKPDNVIIVTDSDGEYRDYNSSASVPGCVWFLWRRGDNSPKFRNAVRGSHNGQYAF